MEGQLVPSRILPCPPESKCVRDEVPRTWEKQWRNSSSPSESKATYLTVCDSQLGKVAFDLLGRPPPGLKSGD